MLDSPVSALTDLALATFHARETAAPNEFRVRGVSDAVLDSAPDMSLYFAGLAQSGAMQRAEQSLLNDPALASLNLRTNDSDILLESPSGTDSISASLLPFALVNPALRLMYFRDAEPTEGALASLVIENYEELKRAVRGEAVRTHAIYGLTGLTVPKGVQVMTPWGIVKSAPAPNPQLTAGWPGRGAVTTAVLIRQRLTKIGISREPSNADVPSMAPMSEEYFAEDRRIQELLPLAFALATSESNRCAPMTTFRTDVEPFSSSWGSSSSSRPYRPQVVALTTEQVPTVEEWARRINSNHAEGLHVAARRTVSAIAERSDMADALIDAVTVWESLVGTRTETVFRVTAALALLLEAEPEARAAFRKRLGGIYDVRSRVVHGDTVDAESVRESATGAIDIAVAATRALYERGGDWLTMKSAARADRLILGT